MFDGAGDFAQPIGSWDMRGAVHEGVWDFSPRVEASPRETFEIEADSSIII